MLNNKVLLNSVTKMYFRMFYIISVNNYAYGLKNKYHFLMVSLYFFNLSLALSSNTRSIRIITLRILSSQLYIYNNLCRSSVLHYFLCNRILKKCINFVRFFGLVVTELLNQVKSQQTFCRHRQYEHSSFIVLSQ